jgi:REP element-mobilizing transposase RayT
MKQETPRRRDTRLKGWNYRLPGPYAITLCTQNRIWLYGDVCDGLMSTNTIGAMVQDVWHDLATEFPTITLDAFVVMPNHIHGIVFLAADHIEDNPDLGTVVQRFKSITTTRYINGVLDAGWQPFDGRLWQRNYYDHIVRDDRDLDRCRRYIDANPGNWHDDQDYEPDVPLNQPASKP